MEPASLTTGLLMSWKYLALFPLLIVEGFVVTIVAGFLVSTNTLSFYPTLLTVVLGDISSDIFYYSLGYRGSGLLKSKLAKLIGLEASRVKRVEVLYKKHGGKILVIAKLTNALSLAAIVAAGLIKMPFRQFIIFCVVTAIPKALILILIGYFFGQAYTDVSQITQYFFLGSTLTILLFFSGRCVQKLLMGSKVVTERR